MGLGLLLPWLLFLLPLFFTISASQSQQPNTDGSLVRDFLQQMRAPPLPSTSSSICPSGISCETQGDHVIRLVASGLGLRGGIPANTIGKLSKLQHLDLSNNSITGFASDFWGLGESLRSLNLSANRIGGFLPNDVGNLGELESLDLSRNELSGQLPRSIGSLQRLNHLNLSTNMLEGSIPNELLQCRSLVTVDLSSNRLDGSVPDGLGSAFVNLTALNLAGNRITGRLPDFSGSLSITYLNVSGNLFSDSISGVLRRPLQVVDLSNNRFTGHISQVKLSSSSSGWPNLTYLDLSGNRLSGFLFDDLSESRSLRHLNIAGNRFSRQSFPALGKLSSLQYLNLSRTGLTGKIPREMSMLVGLSVLDLCQNHLTGRIPDLRIQSLEVLDLSTNNLTGDIPLLLQEKLPHMLKFNFSYNNLTFCSSKFSPETLKSAFVGSHDDCPIAANPPDPAGGKKGGGSGKKKLKLALAISLSAFFFVVGLVCLALGCRRRRGRRGRRGMPWDAAKPPQCKEDPNVSGPFSFETDSRTWVADVKDATSVPVVIFEKPLLSFTFADLLSATSHFDRGTLLAEGKFGPVYRGLLPGGIHVAVKVLVHGSTLSDQEAAGEFERLGRIKHPNLVPLTGYCLAGDQRIAVYEYMEHGNLQNLLHDLPLGIQTTDDWTNDTWEDENDGAQSVASEGHTTWRFRHMIVLGVARALAFLHHGCIPLIIHRDVKASSIFLGSEFEPRLSDFGLAKIVGTRFEDEIARGAPGYAPPELSGPEPSSATTKTDVYAFGVVLFELLTGKKPIGDEYPEEKDASLVAWVRGLVRKNRGSDAIDPKIHGTGEEKQMEEALRIGYLCTADTPSKRPSMQQVVGLLKDIEPGGTDQ